MNIGHNNPPDPIEEITAQYADYIEEAENWLDGSKVETEDQMKAVDAIRKELRAARIDLVKGQKSATAPLYDAYKAELARWKPTIEDVSALEKGLVAAVGEFKQKLADEKEAERRALWEAAERKKVEAEHMAAEASKADIEAQRAIRAAREEAIAADEAARNVEAVKGLRKVTKWEITDERALARWIWEHDMDAMRAFLEGYAKKCHNARFMEGVRVWEEKEAF